MLVPFGGSEHDWTAIELGAWLAGALDVPFRLAGPREKEPRREPAARKRVARDTARLRRDRRAVAFEPVPQGLVAAADDAALVVVGLTERWQRDGLGPVRAALAAMRVRRSCLPVAAFGPAGSRRARA